MQDNSNPNNNTTTNNTTSPTTTSRTSPFFSLLRLTSQTNIQDLLSGNNSNNNSNNNNINILYDRNSGGRSITISNTGLTSSTPGTNSISTTTTTLNNINNSSSVSGSGGSGINYYSGGHSISINPNDINELLSYSMLSQFPTTVSKGVLGNATFFEAHHRAVKGIDFSPNDDFIFASCGIDGKVNLYSARFGKLLSSSVISFSGTVNFSGLKFLHGGDKIALSTSSNKLLIFDIEKAAIVQSFDKCTYSSAFKTKIERYPDDVNLLVCPNITGKGISQIDIRTPNPIKNIDQIHQNTINDIKVLDRSWSRFYNGASYNGGNGGNNLILTASSDSTAKLIDCQKNIVKQFDFSSTQHSIAITPEQPSNNHSALVVGSDRLSIFQIDGTLENVFFIPQCKSITNLHYSHSGTKLFLSGPDGNLKILNRSDQAHDLLGTVYKHSRDIQDLSISKNDEYLVTASTDSKVGLIRIGDPMIGCKEVGELL